MSAEPEGPPVIEVRGVDKTFRIPKQRVDSLKERALHPFRGNEFKELRALRDITFEIHEGEFFGIVVRNGSGKSTLLKILASIYRADAGTIRMAGRLAPFIELGVGFNLDLTARENVVLNGVMMGLSPRQTRGRLDAVLDFAELGDFIDLKLKNYSSGMLVRLAFSTMIQAGADVMLIDEVLAVGDASFQQKCANVFQDLRAKGKTIVLVTHDMGAVQQYCHRAMLIHDGSILQIGAPREVARAYLRLNFSEVAEGEEPGTVDLTEDVKLLDAWIEDGDGGRVTNVEQGETIRLRAEIEALRDVPKPRVGFLIANGMGTAVFEFGAPVTDLDDEESLSAGRRVRVSVELENPLAPGRYYVGCGVSRNGRDTEVALYEPNAAEFTIFGLEHFNGIVNLEHEMEARVEGGGEG